MELRQYLHILRKGWPVVLGFVVLGTALGVLLTASTKKVYEASVEVFVATSTTSSALDLANGNTFAQERVQSYTSIANSPAVTGAVISKLGLPLSTSQLAAKISADAPQNKVLINLHVTDHSPSQAATLANAVAAQFATVVQDTEQTDADGKPVVKLTVIHPATVPSKPIKPSKTINIGLGFLLGLLAGVGVVVLREVLDNTVKGPADFEPLGVPVLGYIPLDKRTSTVPIAFRGDLHSARSEAYRQLRTNLQFVNVDHTPRVIAVTSAIPGEGKTITALNLAAALAEAGYRVCLVEADLRRPNLAKVLDLAPDVGFTTALIRQAPLETVLQNAGRNLAVLTSGPVPPNPSELLMTEQAGAIIKRISAEVDYTIIDTAPLLPVSDGAEIAILADATLVVHHAGKSTKEQAQRAIEALEKVGEKPVGVVLNMITRGRGRYDDEYGYYYTTYRPELSHRRKPEDKPKPDRRRVAAAPVSAPTPSDSAPEQERVPTKANHRFEHSAPARYGPVAEHESMPD